MKKQTPSEFGAAKLKPLIEYVHIYENRGTILELAKILSDKTGEKIYRQYVENWLHPDPEKRIEPKLGIGLLLIEEGNRLIGALKNKQREVFIMQGQDSWFVMYADRKPRQRVSAAGFFMKDHTRQDVEKWISGNPKLKLIANHERSKP